MNRLSSVGMCFGVIWIVLVLYATVKLDAQAWEMPARMVLAFR